MLTPAGLALVAWPLVVLALFRALPPRRAVLVSFIAAWLFLPVASYAIPHAPDYTKMMATGLSALLGVAVFDTRRLGSVRLGWVDLPILVFCLVPLGASLTSGLGAYDGLSAAFERSVTWGLPYLLGRLYFGDLAGLRDLALGILIGGLVYVPLCLIEIIAGPHLRELVYGLPPTDLGEATRFGGWRPVVFMQTGLMVALWMAAASVIGVWLWLARSTAPLSGPLSLWERVGVRVRWLQRFLTPILILLLVGTTFLLKSVNAWLLLPGGLVLLALTTKLRHAWPVVGLMLVVVAYLLFRATGGWTGQELSVAAGSVFGARKDLSLAYRFDNEALVVHKVGEQPWFGYGRRSPLFYTPPQHEVVVFDSLWIIAYGESGVIGLVALVATLVVPIVVGLRRFPPRTWAEPGIAPAAALLVVLCLYLLDNLLNGMVNPIYMLAAGGLVGGWPDMEDRTAGGVAL